MPCPRGASPAATEGRHASATTKTLAPPPPELAVPRVKARKAARTSARSAGVWSEWRQDTEAMEDSNCGPPPPDSIAALTSAAALARAAAFLPAAAALPRV